MAMVFFAMRRMPGMERHGLYWWGLANIQFATAAALFVTRDHWHGLVAIGAANIFYLSGIGMLLVGTREHFGAPQRRGLIAAGVIATTLPMLYFTFGEENTRQRMIVVGLFASLILFDLARLCLGRLLRQAGRFPALLVGGVALTGALLNLLRSGQFIWAAQGGAPFMSPEQLQLLFGFFNAFAIIALAVGFLMLAHEKLRTTLERQVAHDALTGALSRTGFLNACESAFKRADRLRKPVCLAFMDLDHFKAINDVYGHMGGDRVLEHFASMTGRSLRAHDLIGRLGGEEFGLLFTDNTIEDARLHSYRLRGEIEKHGCPSDEHWIMYTVSIGLVERMPGETMSSLLRRADMALYAAKAAGRNTVSIGRGTGTDAQSVGPVPAVA